MSTATAFLELKRFLGGIESTTQKLKASVAEGKSTTPSFGVEGDAFVDSLASSVTSVQSRLDVIESSICGAVESRLSQVTMLEILQKCKALYRANERMISDVEKHMADYGYTAPIDEMLPPPNGEQPPTSDVIDKEAEAGKIEVESIDRESLPLTNQIIPVEADDTVYVHEANSPQSDNLKTDDCRSPEGTASSIFADSSKAYQSPQVAKTPADRGSEHEAKTPALPDWKLSEATRMLMQNKDGKDATRGRTKLVYMDDSSTPESNLNQVPDDNTPKTPCVLNLSVAPVPQSRQVLMSNIRGKDIALDVEGEMLTPQPVIRQSYRDDEDSPLTPCFGTPFNTTRLRTAGQPAEASPSSPNEVESKLARTLVLTPQSPDHLPISGSVLNQELASPITPRILSHQEKDFEPIFSLAPDGADSTDQTAKTLSKQLFSPPKIAILAPRPADIRANVPSSSSSIIQAVTAEEWETAPAFLKKQVGVNHFPAT